MIAKNYHQDFTELPDIYINTDNKITIENLYQISLYQ